jgi:CubicO group peptidase (beta-lactamase class C family)
LQNVGSVSKTLIGVSLMQLVEQGKIKLDDDINTYLPFKVINPYFPQDRITVRHLATHTSTLKDTNDFWLKDYLVADPTQLSRPGMAKDPVLRADNTRVPTDQFIKNLVAREGARYSKSNFLKQKPGTTFEYSNLGADLAAYIVERVTGETFAEYSDKTILKPIGMTHSGWSFDKVSMDRFVSEYGSGMKLLPRYSEVAYPAGGLITSIEDISKYLMEMIRGYQGESTLMRKDSFREMMRVQSNNNSGMGYGIFCAVWANGYIGHSGGDPGTTTRIFFDAKTNTGTAMFMNTTRSDRKGNPVAQDFLDIEKALGWP